MAFTKATILALLTSSVFAVALPSALDRRVPAQCIADTIKYGDRTFYISCNVDRPGGDYTNLQSPTRVDCIQACIQDKRCVSATWKPENGFCYLKDTITWESLYTSDQTFTLGTGCQNRDRKINGRQCTVECGTDHHGGDYDKARLNSFEACAQACASDSKCATAQYVDSTGWCYFKNIVTTGNDVTKNSDVDTIICRK